MTQSVFPWSQEPLVAIFNFFDFFQNGGHFYAVNIEKCRKMPKNGRHFEKNEKNKKSPLGALGTMEIHFVLKFWVSSDIFEGCVRFLVILSKRPRKLRFVKKSKI